MNRALPEVNKRRKLFQRADVELQEFLLQIEEFHGLTIVEMMNLLGNAMERFTRPMVQAEWEEREADESRCDGTVGVSPNEKPCGRKFDHSGICMV